MRIRPSCVGRTSSVNERELPLTTLPQRLPSSSKLDLEVRQRPQEISRVEQLSGSERAGADGTLAPEETYDYAPSELDPDGPQVTAVGDVNGDGKPDVVSIATTVSILYHR